MSKDPSSSTSGDEMPKQTPGMSCEEAAAKLEDHRCAICDNVLINACRIGCGHTFCRLCINLHKETRNERGKPTCFICDAAMNEIAYNSTRDKEIDGLYALLSTDERLARARLRAERKAEEEQFDTDIRNGSHECRDAGSSNDSSASGDAAEHASINDDRWSEGFANSQEEGGADALTFYFEHDDPHSFWQHDNQDNERDEEFHAYSNYEEDAHVPNDDDPDHDDDGQEVNPGPNICQHQQPQPPIIIHHTVQHIYHTVEVQNSTTYQANQVGDDTHHQNRRQQLRHDQCSENSMSDGRNAIADRLHPFTCRRTQGHCSESRSPTVPNHFQPGPFYHNVCPTYIPTGYYPHYTTRPAVSNFPCTNPHSNPRLLSPMSVLSPICYRGSESYPPHPMSHLIYASPPSPPVRDRYPDRDHNEFHRVPSSSYSCECENACEFHRHNCDGFPRSPCSSGTSMHFGEEETVGEDEDDDVLCVLQEEGSDTNCQFDYDDQSELDDQSRHHQRITLNLTVPIPDNIRIRTRDPNDHRPSTCCGYILELE